ncbi:sugar ABC transporter permease [Schaalia sp. ZJ405]|uniref:carbohydrate ABC transporter permease n=1 Tax=Schaalia sp. ZJ405 TaxID=2709403 RepID=UPI0013EAF2F0|nr:sugar ABC transporter permease [Schaalia sp. ZJ405]QPK81333.1 sugar ABC transporter permease [Schaalia sp. ZJ405]
MTVRTDLLKGNDGFMKSRSSIIQRIKGTAVPYAYLTPTLTLLTMLMATPIIMVVWYSFQSGAITDKNPHFVGFDNYIDVLTDPKFHTALANTVWFVVLSVVAHMIIGLAFAMMLNASCLSTFTKTFFRTLFVLPWLLTVAIIAILWRLILNPNGVANALLSGLGLIEPHKEWLADPHLALAAIILINIWAGYPFFMISILAGLQGIPADLYEAAEVDGAGPIRRFWSITLPQLKPIIVSMALLDIIWTSQQFALIWMTTGGGPLNKTEMLSTYTYKLAFAKYAFSSASSSAVIVLILSMLLAFFYVQSQRARD